mmetsp:Transcript_31904/g.81342  ORF Transcript_31904/g.81342 Transcript_31904/m.81342 type:complete len:209 (+) Transcript_31904:72-698(+)
MALVMPSPPSASSPPSSPGHQLVRPSPALSMAAMMRIGGSTATGGAAAGAPLEPPPAACVLAARAEVEAPAPGVPGREATFEATAAAAVAATAAREAAFACSAKTIWCTRKRIGFSRSTKSSCSGVTFQTHRPSSGDQLEGSCSSVLGTWMSLKKPSEMRTPSSSELTTLPVRISPMCGRKMTRRNWTAVWCAALPGCRCDSPMCRMS